MPFCPGCGGGGSPGFESGADVHHILGCGFQGLHQSETHQDHNEGRHNQGEQESQVTLLREALKVAGGDPGIARALFDALEASLGKKGAP